MRLLEICFYQKEGGVAFHPFKRISLLPTWFKDSRYQFKGVQQTGKQVRLPVYNLKKPKRIQNINELHHAIKENLFFLIGNIVQNFETEKAFTS